MKTCCGAEIGSRHGFLAFAAVFLAVTIASGQTFRGTVLGTVTDETGAAVPGATVTVRNTDTGLLRTTESQANGSYAVPELPIGTYDVTIDKTGFQTSVTKAVPVTVAAEKRVDAALKLGQVTEQILVSGAELPQIDTVSDTLGGTLTQDTVKDLPVNGRDYTKLIYLNPGVAGSPDQITDSPGSFGEFSMNGARGRSNNYLLDGTDMNDGYRNDPAINQGGVFATPSAILPIDAVEDMAVLSNFAPEYGRNGGAVVNIVTRSGTNKLHGTAFEYFRNNALDARNFFDTSANPKAPFHNNQFGGSLGGPIVKDKTFFFVDYEGQQERVGVVTLACVPEPARIAVDRAASGFVDNPVIDALLARNPWPAPDHPISAAQASNTLSSMFNGVLGRQYDAGCPNGPNASLITPSYNKLTSMIAKIDHTFNQSNTVTGRYFFGDSTQSFPLALSASGGQLPGFNTVTPTRVQLVSLSYVHVFSPTKLNEVRFGWNRFAEGFFPEDQNFHPSSIGLCAASNAPGGSAAGPTCSGSGPADSGLPIILVSVTPSGASSFFAQPGANSTDPRHRVDTNIQVIDGFSWKINKHDLKFGFEFRRTSVQQYLDKYFRGRLKFADLSAFLAGTDQSGVTGSLQYFGNTVRHTFENDYGLYFQDSYHLLPRLNFNYGLRWDHFGVIAEKNHLFSNFVIANTGAGVLEQVGTPTLPKLYQPDYRNFSPRVSIAWDVFGNGKTVVRSGFGLFYDSTSQDMFLGHLPYPAFFAPGPAYSNSGANVITSAGATGTIAPGVPIYQPSNCSRVECDIFGVDQNIKTPYIENDNLNIQQQITSKMSVQIGYVGSQGHRLWRFFDINQPNAQAIHDAQCPGALGAALGSDCSGTAGAAPVSFSAPRPFGNPNPNGAVYIFQENSKGRSNYNSLQASLHVSGWHGVTSFVNFVWSRSMDNSSDGEDFVPNAAQPADSTSTNPKNEYGPSNFNIPRRFTWVFNYELPKLAGGWQKMKNGWGLDSTVTLQTGQPFTLNYNAEDDYSGSGEGYDRPDVVGPIVYNYHDPNNFLDLSSFAMPCTNNGTISGFASDCRPGTQHFGNLGRNALQGPPFKQWDLAIYKSTTISERVSLQLRAEFFNILNHPNFSNPLLPAFIADPASNVSPFTSCTCGFAKGTGNREVGNGFYHIVATGDVGIGNPFLGGGAPRGIQLAAKFTF
jgi:Carboxypeptidase regulatory-like domain/TonB-dependent Receptor Plug Domain/TonB dependent receptor